MRGRYKILVAGTGGQGIVYLTGIIAEAAMLSGIPVMVSEIHGLSQRGGTVTAGIGLGKYTSGFTGTADTDMLIGLEPMEAQRCLSHLHKDSSVIFGGRRVVPYAVNAGNGIYPDPSLLREFLEQRCREVDFVFEEDSRTIQNYNIYLLGRAARMKSFPLKPGKIEEAIRNVVMPEGVEQSVRAFRSGYGNNKG